MNGEPEISVREVMAARYQQLATLRWRQGRTLGRTVYAVTGGDYLDHVLIGVMDSEALAEAACADHNAAVQLGEGREILEAQGARWDGDDDAD